MLEGRGRRVYEVQEQVVIGRSRTCHLRLEDVLVSRKHAEIFRRGESYFVRDLGSRNGTKVNGKLVSEQELKPFDCVTVGNSRLLFYTRKPRNWTGEVVGGCKIIEPVGAGATGTVYKAVQLSMDRVVALKILSEKYASDKRFIRQFIVEARTAGKIEHPNVIRVYDVGESEGAFYYTMEYVNGASLAEIVRERGRLGVREAVEIVKKVALALDYAHRQGLLHRDVKPGNILVSLDGEAKLADLGLARPVESGPDEKAIGTPLFMSPEQILGKELSPPSDLYSLGAVFYFALTGQPPFSGSSKREVMEKHLREEAVPVDGLRPDVPPGVSSIVKRLLCKSPEDRFPSARSLIDALNELEGLELETRKNYHPLISPEEETTQGAKLRAVPGSVVVGVFIVEFAVVFIISYYIGRILAQLVRIGGG